jgi:Rrf2 family protein
MLTLTRRTDYALIALVHLAQAPEACCSAREIASKYHLPLPLLMNLLKVLTQKGLAKSVRGPRGGYTLALPAEKISLHDIICAVEGPTQLVLCIEQNKGDAECGLVTSCPVHSPIHRVHDRLIQFLSGVSLAEIVQTPAVADEAGRLVQISGISSATSEEFTNGYSAH